MYILLVNFQINYCFVLKRCFLPAGMTDQVVITKDSNELQYFNCDLCGLREKYEYFGRAPPFSKNFKLSEDSYLIEDPFTAPKQGEILIIGAHCIVCNKMVCKDTPCSLYYHGTYCFDCAKVRASTLPKAVQEKLSRIVK